MMNVQKFVDTVGAANLREQLRVNSRQIYNAKAANEIPSNWWMGCQNLWRDAGLDPEDFPVALFPKMRGAGGNTPTKHP